MNWATVMNGIHAWFIQYTGLAASHVLWAGQPVPHSTYPLAILSLDNITSAGQDSTVYSAPNINGLITPKQQGIRYITLSCDLRVMLNPENPLTPTNNPDYYLELLRDAMWNPDGLALLRAAGIGIVRTLATVKLDKTVDNARVELRRVMDVRLAVASNTVYNSTDYIESVDATGTIGDITIDTEFGE